MKDLLPIGTVVLLKEATKKIMIIGYLPVTEEQKTFDYSGVLWPEGLITTEQSLLFNNDDISQIFFNGFKNEESEEFNKKINELLANKQQN